MRKYVLIGLALVSMAGSACNAADLSGTVTTSKGAPARDAVVYLVGSIKSHPLDHAVIDQRGKKFIPHVLAVTKGTKVSFPNSDTVLHNVFAYYNAKRFDLGVYPRGTSRSETFDKTGIVALLCNVHSDMSAYIVVVDTPYYAVTDHDGKFHIDNIDAGNYTLLAWHESGELAQQPIAISDNKSVTVSLKRK